MDRYEWSGTGEEKMREFGSRLPEGSRENEKRNTEMAGIHCVDHINNDNGDSNNDGNRKNVTTIITLVTITHGLGSKGKTIDNK